jgi:thioredoxin-like negative regulator of GroEL
MSKYASAYSAYKDLSKNEKPVYKIDEDTSTPEVTTQEQQREIVRSNTVCLFYVFSKSCNPCKEIAPEFSKLVEKYTKPGECVLYKQNVKNLEGASKIIDSVPAFVFVKNRKIVGTIQGGQLYGEGGVEDTLIDLLLDD